MPVESISRSYTLSAIKVSPLQLLLDPNNPRIKFDLDADRDFKPSEIQDPKVQKYLGDRLNNNCHHVADLVQSISANGFTYGGGKIIVQQVRGTRKYLVLEGNRRTAAIRQVLQQSATHSAHELGLGELMVDEFKFRPGTGHTEAVAIQHLMALHMDGPLPWGALEKAYYAYSAYMNELRVHYRTSIFIYRDDCARQVAARLHSTPAKLRKMLTVYRIFEQLRSGQYAVKPDHNTLIEMVVTNRALSADYFEVNTESFECSQTGLEKFNRICIEENCPVNNPSDFRKFAKVVKFGKPALVTAVVWGENSLDKVLEHIENSKAKNGWRDELDNILNRLSKLAVEQFNGTPAEKSLIRQIKELVDRKFSRLL